MILWHQVLLHLSLTHCSMILLNFKNFHWFCFLYWPSLALWISHKPLVFSRPNTDFFGSIYCQANISLEKILLVAIYQFLICFNYVRNIKTKEALLVHLQIQVTSVIIPNYLMFSRLSYILAGCPMPYI